MCQRHAYRTCPRHNCICVQDTAIYVSRARLYMCPGHNHRRRLANVTETHFNQTIVGPQNTTRFCMVRETLPYVANHIPIKSRQKEKRFRNSYKASFLRPSPRTWVQFCRDFVWQSRLVPRLRSHVILLNQHSLALYIREQRARPC